MRGSAALAIMSLTSMYQDAAFRPLIDKLLASIRDGQHPAAVHPKSRLLLSACGHRGNGVVENGPHLIAIRQNAFEVEQTIDAHLQSSRATQGV
jgi:hypothetical protein